MKNYEAVVRGRYNRQKYDSSSVRNNKYMPINPTGFYGEFKANQVLFEFINMLYYRKKDLHKIRVCDCGCGDGNKTRFMAELLLQPNQVFGTEYSKIRLEHCKRMNNHIHYRYADLTKEIPFDIQFDGITAFVVFMHFSSHKEINNALKNIYNSLNKNGLFLWYELGAKDHWDGTKEYVDSWGFSESQMDEYAFEVGFKLVRHFGVCTKIPIINQSSGYLIKNIKDLWMMELLEKFPFKKNNFVRIYSKG
ncbi:MAG: class I SAM-dependent methyltransferase [Lachnospiraceae bacterium]|nr:class I SAM-dependent methyltransferase [Lachnospiraceae bacterium]